MSEGASKELKFVRAGVACSINAGVIDTGARIEDDGLVQASVSEAGVVVGAGVGSFVCMRCHRHMLRHWQIGSSVCRRSRSC